MEILNLLGIDSSLLLQLAVIFVTFIVVKALLFKKLRFVVEQRELQTKGLEEAANKKNEKANQLADTYRLKIDETYGRIQKDFAEEKRKLAEQNNEKIKSAEGESEKLLAKSKTEFVEEIQHKKDKLLSEADSLASSLVSKVAH